MPNYDLPADRRKGSWSRTLARLSIRSWANLIASGAGLLRIAEAMPSKVPTSTAASSRAKPCADEDIAPTACHFMVRSRSRRASTGSGGLLISNSKVVQHDPGRDVATAAAQGRPRKSRSSSSISSRRFACEASLSPMSTNTSRTRACSPRSSGRARLCRPRHEGELIADLAFAAVQNHPIGEADHADATRAAAIHPPVWCLAILCLARASANPSLFLSPHSFASDRVGAGAGRGSRAFCPWYATCIPRPRRV